MECSFIPRTSIVIFFRNFKMQFGFRYYKLNSYLRSSSFAISTINFLNKNLIKKLMKLSKNIKEVFTFFPNEYY